MYQIVLIRHGESIWNKENRFTGWYDIDLTDTGAQQAKQAGRLLVAKGFQFDIAYSSVLIRANKTLSIVLDEMERSDLPIVKDWRLNERHYAALTALDHYGRPNDIQLLVLIDRRFSRDLPIQPDYVGLNVDTLQNDRVSVNLQESNIEDAVYILKDNNETNFS